MVYTARYNGEVDCEQMREHCLLYPHQGILKTLSQAADKSLHKKKNLGFFKVVEWN